MKRFALLALCAGFLACNDDTPAIPECTPGRAIACVCPDAQFGMQVCEDAGAYGPCDCGCGSGYETDGEGGCIDIDECSRALDNCDVNADCTNTDGSFDCVCGAGFDGDGRRCIDVDECMRGTYTCDPQATCQNTIGGYSCTCGPGYSGDGSVCDIDECALGTDACHPEATCTNTIGSYLCVCNAGFSGNGISCVNVDECGAGTDDCDANADCFDTFGSFDCVCRNGYQGDGTACANIDECAAGTDNCGPNSICTDEVPGFSCACDDGFIWDGTGCIARADVVADLGAGSVAWEIAGNGTFDVHGLSRIGADLEVFETPSGAGTHKSPGAMSYADITLRNVEGSTAEVNTLPTWFSFGSHIGNARDALVRLQGLDGEQMDLEIYQLVPVAIDATITDLGAGRAALAEIVLRILRPAPGGIVRTGYVRANSGNFPECPYPGEYFEVSGVQLSPGGNRGQCYAAGTLPIPAPGATYGIPIPDVRFGDVGDDWFIYFASSWLNSAFLDRRSMFVLEYDTAISDETRRTNLYEAWPSSIDYFDPTQEYGAHYLINLYTVHDFSEPGL